MEVSKAIANHWRILVAISLVLFGVGWRLIPHAPNFAPIGAIALVSSSLVSRRLALVLPIGSMVLSDILLGFYQGIVWTWLAFASVAGFGMIIRKFPSLWRMPVGAFGASTLFFIISNFGVWVASGMYPPTLSGFIACYVMAIPFFTPTLASDVCFYTLFSAAQQLAPSADKAFKHPSVLSRT